MGKNKPKGQHSVPQCYLREFVDPDTPINQEPYVWIFKKESWQGRKKAPSNILKGTDLYTLQIISGEKNYTIEEALAELEGRYANIFRTKIKKFLPLNEEEHIVLCAFVAAMLQRTKRSKENLEKFLEELAEKTEAIEKHHGVKPIESERLQATKKDAYKLTILSNMPEITRLLSKMSLAFMCVPSKKKKFITSDDPCNLFNPDLQWQRWLGPGLGQKNIQLTIPLSPAITACFTWVGVKGYLKITNNMVDDLNRTTRAMSYEYFIANNSRTKLIWFSRYPLSITFFYRIIKRKITGLANYFSIINVGK